VGGDIWNIGMRGASAGFDIGNIQARLAALGSSPACQFAAPGLNMICRIIG